MLWDAMRPHASDSGSYVNFMAEPDEDRVRAVYGAGHVQVSNYGIECVGDVTPESPNSTNGLATDLT
jgi:hypothetical protein